MIQLRLLVLAATQQFVLGLALVVLCLGVAVTAVAEDDDLLALSLDQLVDLEVTTASKLAESIHDAAGIITVITAQEIEMYDSRNLGELLNKVTSAIFLSANVVTDNLVSFRKQSLTPYNTHVLILLNGRPLRDPIAGGLNHSVYAVFPVDAIANLEIIRGPGSVLYGSNAYSAVINIKTLTQEEDGSRTIARVTGGSWDSFAQSGVAIVRKGDIAATFAVSHWEDAGPDYEFTSYGDPATTDISQKSNWFRETTGIMADISLKGLRAQFYYGDFQPESLWPSNNSWMPKRTWDTGRSVAVFGDLGIEGELGENTSGSFNVTYNNHQWYSWEENWTPRTEASDYLGEGTLYRKFGEKTNLVFGSTVQYSVFKSDLLINGTETAFSFYSQCDHWLTDEIKLIGGVQYNKPEGIKGQFSPRAGVVTHPGDAWTIKALYSQAFRSGSRLETAFDHPVFRGSPELRPELIDTYEAQFSFQNDRLHASLTGYYSQMSDVIERRWIDDPSVDIYGGYLKHFNGDVHDFSGVEFEWRASLSDHIMFQGSASYMQDKDSEDNKNITLHPQKMLKTGLVFQESTFLVSIWNSIFSNLTQVNDYVEPGNEYPEPNPHAGDFSLLSAKVVVNLSEVASLASGNELKLSIWGENILDRDVRYPEYTTRQLNSLTPLRGGRALYGSVSLDF